MGEIEEELRSEISAIEESLADSHDDSFVAEIVRAQMERRLAELRARLDAALDRTIELRFSKRWSPGSHGLSTSLLASILGRLQTTLTYGTWAMKAGPSVAGNVPRSVERDAATEVVATPPGSFGLLMRKEELGLSDDFDKSVLVVFDLARAATREELDGDVEQLAQSLGPEATRRAELFFRKLAESDLDTDLSWQSGSSRRSLFLSKEQAGALSEWLAVAIPRIDTFDVIGYLRRADTINGSFRVESQATGQLFEGGSDPEVLAHAEMDALYKASIEETIRSAPHTGRSTSKYRLVALSAPD